MSRRRVSGTSHSSQLSSSTRSRQQVDLPQDGFVQHNDSHRTVYRPPANNGAPMTRLPTPEFDKPLPEAPNRTMSLFSRHGKRFIDAVVAGASSTKPEGPDLKSGLTSSRETTGRIPRQTTSPNTFGSSTKRSSTPSRTFTSTSSSARTLVDCDKFTRKWPRLGDSMRRRKRKGLESVSGSSHQVEEGGFLELNGQRIFTFGFEKMEEWTGPKWWLLFSSLTVFGYGCACLVLSLATLFRAYPSAEIPATLDPALLVLSTLLSSLLLLSSICGLTGTLLSSRFTLSIYTILLFPSFFSLLAVGYTAYKRHTFALPSKLDHAWSAYLTPYGRLLIQSSLKCCGWFSPSHEATLSSRCYPRIALPGCKARLIRYERATLKWVYTTAFSLAPLHMVNMVIALLCSNHVNRVWGMRVPPRKYWLSGEDVREAASRVYAGEGEAFDGHARRTFAKGDGLDEDEWCRAPGLARASSSAVGYDEREDRGGLWSREGARR